MATVLALCLYVGAVLLLASAVYGWTVPADIRNFDGYSIRAATKEFVHSAGELAIAGLFVGTICSGLILLATRRSGELAA
jgi:hypothetical protein